MFYGPFCVLQCGLPFVCLPVDLLFRTQSGIFFFQSDKASYMLCERLMTIFKKNICLMSKGESYSKEQLSKIICHFLKLFTCYHYLRAVH